MSKPYDAAFRSAEVQMSTVKGCLHDPLGWHPERTCGCPQQPVGLDLLNQMKEMDDDVKIITGITADRPYPCAHDPLGQYPDRGCDCRKYPDAVGAKPGLPTDAAARKNIPVATGFVSYFPKAMVAVAECSKKGNDQHNPGKPLFWDRSKSGDEADALMRHFLERGTIDTDGIRHSAKVAWRAMALLEKELEAAGAK